MELPTTRMQVRAMNHEDLMELANLVSKELEYRQKTSTSALRELKQTSHREAKEYLLVIAQIERHIPEADILEYYNLSKGTHMYTTQLKGQSCKSAYVRINANREVIESMLRKRPPVSSKDDKYYAWSFLRYADRVLSPPLMSRVRRDTNEVEALQLALAREVGHHH